MISNFSKYISKNTGILIRMDDITENMNWAMFDKVEVLFDRFNIKPVLGIIPSNKDTELLTYPKKEDFWSLAKRWKEKGWEISMHGFDHVYKESSDKKDYFGHGGKSEFCGLSLEEQSHKIKKGLEIFKEKNLDVKSFFAPNHTYDENTFLALKKHSLHEVIDGYGLMPYEKNNIKFIPQLFYKNFILPFGIQSTQLHINYWEDKDFKNFEMFVERNKSKFITYEDAISKVNNSPFYSIIKQLSEVLLRTKRILIGNKNK